MVELFNSIGFQRIKDLLFTNGSVKDSQGDPLVCDGAVFRNFSTHIIRAAKPVGLWAASVRTCGLIRAALIVLGLGQLLQPGLLFNKRAVSSSCSTVGGIRAAEPIGFGAASTRAGSLIGATLPGLGLGQLHQEDPLVCKIAFRKCGCAPG